LTGTERYRNEQRLRGEVIADILAGSRPRRSGSVLIHVMPNGLEYSRLGLVVPKRLLPRAVDRNRARRLLREWFRRNQTPLVGKDLLVRLSVRPGQLESLIADLGRVIVS
jgi:ribonuclease P protein component